MLAPTALSTLERSRRLSNRAIYAVNLQVARIRRGEPEDEEFLLRWDADAQFLIVALQRLRRAASISLQVPAVRDEIKNAIDAFDAALPGLARQRNTAEHIDEYALDSPKRHDKTVHRQMLEVSAFGVNGYWWLGHKIEFDQALRAAGSLFQAVQTAPDRFRDLSEGSSS